MKAQFLALLLGPLAALAAPSPVSETVGEAAAMKRQAETSIDQLMKSKGKLYFGAATEAQHFKDQGKKPEEAILKKDFGQVTPENSLKWKATQPQRGQFNFDAADALVKWAEDNGKSIRGHTLIWHGGQNMQSLPDWVKAIKDKKELTSVIQTHIKTVVGRYKGRIRAWDVVNEIFTNNGAFRSSVFYDVLGEDFVRIAFEAAHAADPNAVLYYNDYNLDRPNHAQLSVGVVPHVKKWIQAGVPIHGIGSQCHLGEGGANNLKAALDALAGTGVKEVAITELDIAKAGSDDYWRAADACMKVSKCVGITTWGVGDVESWRRAEKPLLFDEDWKTKPAYYAAADAIKR